MKTGIIRMYTFDSSYQNEILFVLSTPETLQEAATLQVFEKGLNHKAESERN